MFESKPIEINSVTKITTESDVFQADANSGNIKANNDNIDVSFDKGTNTVTITDNGLIAYTN